ncbi:MAG TPA: DNA double-strand break repair nuclease NurA [Anaerolineales bacterium]|nr:DNA double-strand break repair nuclease NurA [Anaerolineales bacterium]
MTLRLNQLTRPVERMAEVLATREKDFVRRVHEARAWRSTYADRGAALRKVAKEVNAAIPTEEPLDTVVAAPPAPERFTVVGVDGSTIPPDRHGAALYYVINIGSLVYRHGSGETPEARSIPHLGYTEGELFEGTTLVSGNLLDVRRDQAEVNHLANLIEQEPEGPILALVDGTLLLWVLENLPEGKRKGKVQRYLAALTRIRESGAAVAGFISRPRHAEVSRLLLLAHLDGDAERIQEAEQGRLPLPDREIFADLPPGSRSALFVSPNGINPTFYAPAGHEVWFFYINVAAEGEEPVVARIEVPVWVARSDDLLALVHAGVVAQSRIAGGYPYVLARADELAYISGPERQRLQEMVETALLREGMVPRSSPKAFYKSLTRSGRRW